MKRKSWLANVLGSARVSRAGFGVLAETNLEKITVSETNFNAEAQRMMSCAEIL